MKTDLQLQQDVLDELKWEPSVEAQDIGVAAKGGVVTLNGHVSSYGEKHGAEKAAQRVAGVKGVVAAMDVQLPLFHKRTDAELAQSVLQTLEWTAYLPKDKVKVLVEDGHVTLTGEVDWDYQRRSASFGVRFMIGVKGVSNNITVKHDPSTASIKTDIQKAFNRRGTQDENISIKVQGHDVSLAGTVPSWWQRDAAMRTAWSTSGVWNVTDNMAIAP